MITEVWISRQTVNTRLIHNDVLPELNVVTGAKHISHRYRFPDEDYQLGLHHCHPAAMGHSRTGEVRTSYHSFFLSPFIIFNIS